MKADTRQTWIPGTEPHDPRRLTDEEKAGTLIFLERAAQEREAKQKKGQEQ